MMNRYFSILSIILFIGVTLCGCNEDEMPNLKEEFVDIPIPTEGYIFFNTSKVATRGKDMTGTLEADFSVIGYRYPSSWTAAEPLATQVRRITYANNEGNIVSGDATNIDNYMGVFYGTSGKTYTNATPTPQVIKYANGVYGYEPLQSWQKNLSYAFFAWYPSNLVVNPGNNGEYNEEHYGNPFITYTLPTGVNRDARKQMYDVVTACEIDYTKAAGGTTVTFNRMQHRLAALDIKANSLINADALKDSYTEFKNVSSDAAVTVDITNISLTLNGIKTNVKIPLNTEDATEKMEATGSMNKTYTGFQGATGIKYYLVENADGTYTVLDPTSLVGDDELLILIPQEEDITAAIQVEYTVKCGGISKDFSFNTANPQTKVDITINGLESGYYHYLLLNITKSGLFIEAKKNTSWVNQEKVEHTFE